MVDDQSDHAQAARPAPESEVKTTSRRKPGRLVFGVVDVFVGGAAVVAEVVAVGLIRTPA